MPEDNLEKLLDENKGRWFNGAGQRTFYLSSATFLVALMAAFGGLTAYVATLKADIADSKRAIDDLAHQLDKYEASDQTWKTKEEQYDAEVRGTIDRYVEGLRGTIKENDSRVQGIIKENDVATRESLRHINDRVNAVAIARGIQAPP